jgi:hypothetical protein
VPLRGYRDRILIKSENGILQSVGQLFAKYDAVVAYFFQKKKILVLDEVLSKIAEK